MGLVGKKKDLKIKHGGGAAGGSGKEQSSRRPKFVEKIPPCINKCPNHNQIRAALMTVNKAADYEKTYDVAMEQAWHIFAETTPFPSVCGRVCPHPCETECNRIAKEGAVSINAFERHVGDYGLDKKLKPVMLTDEKRSEKIAIIGSGPAGLSCAYHLARRGYPVTVYEAFPKAGGMLRYGIPDYRLPAAILDAEIKRILDMGVELKLNTAVGRDIPFDDLKKDYKMVFVGLGAHQGYKLGVAGEDAENVWTGTHFLHKVNCGEAVEIGKKVVVVGGGDTAIDAARVSRRLGAEVTILYRRTREEMPAIDEEIVGADEEAVTIHYLAAPIEIFKNGSMATGMKCQRMQLGEPDSSGRRRPVPIEGDTFDLEFSTLIAAISQEPDFTGFDNLREGRDWIKVDENFRTRHDGVYAGGDNINLDIAITAIYHGRRAAEAMDAAIRGITIPKPEEMGIIRHEKMKLDFYETKERVKVSHLPVEERFKSLTAEIAQTLSADQAVAESKRCMSCGMCFDCGTCWSYCQDNAIVKPLIKGEKYKFKLDYCKGCDKCAENCPCGYIEMF
jgi:NADPH-dependent glutamate synthase beta subunit-like oxidoreductase/Pyruvate/2-oxoacid:ferredoxin oxidoreductase delta subunit